MPVQAKARVHLVGVIGRGSFGEVYLGRLTTPGGLHQRVAVKVLRSDVVPASQALFRLVDEARLLSALRHDAVPTVFDVVDVDGRTALVTEFVEGEDLAQCLLSAERIGARALMQVIERVADALDAAQSTPGPDGRPLRLVHRDLKPSNLRLTTRGEVKVLDFGVAKANLQDLQAVSTAGTVVGSLAYLAPERLRAVNSGNLAASDIYALGCVIFEGLTGRRLFEPLDLPRRIVLSGSTEDHDAFVGDQLENLKDLPSPVLALLRSALSFDPAQRPVAADLAHRCEELALSLEGDSLRRWATTRHWPELVTGPGDLVGHEVLLGEPVAEAFEISIEPEHDPIGGRFLLQDTLFETGGGRTVRATERSSGKTFLLQEVPLPSQAREAAKVRERVALRSQLAHPSLPTCCEVFEVAQRGSTSLWIQLDGGDGPSLADEVATQRVDAQAPRLPSRPLPNDVSTRRRALVGSRAGRDRGTSRRPRPRRLLDRGHPWVHGPRAVCG